MGSEWTHLRGSSRDGTLRRCAYSERLSVPASWAVLLPSPRTWTAACSFYENLVWIRRALSTGRSDRWELSAVAKLPPDCYLERSDARCSPSTSEPDLSEAWMICWGSCPCFLRDLSSQYQPRCQYQQFLRICLELHLPEPPIRADSFIWAYFRKSQFIEQCSDFPASGAASGYLTQPRTVAIRPQCRSAPPWLHILTYQTAWCSAWQLRSVPLPIKLNVQNHQLNILTQIWLHSDPSSTLLAAALRRGSSHALGQLAWHLVSLYATDD